MKKILVSLIIIFIGVNIITLCREHNWGDDFSAYIGQAKAIVDGRMGDYADAANYRVANSEAQVGPNLYPWGYPLVLVPVIAMFGINIIALKFVTYLFFIGSLAVSYFLFKKELTKNISLLLVLILAASPYFFELKENVLSDVPAMFFLLLSVLFIQKIYFENKKSKKIYMAFLGFSIFASVFVRTNSIVVIPLLFLVQAIERKKWLKSFSEAASNTTPYAVFLALYLVSRIFFPGSSYANQSLLASGLIIETAIKNLNYYLVVLADFFGNPAKTSVWVAYFLSGIFFLTGVFKNFRENYIYLLFSALTLGLFLIFPYQQGLRYILPVIPFYLFFVALGTQNLHFEKISKALKAEKIAYVLGFALIAFFSFQISALAKLPPPDGPFSKNSENMFEYIKGKTDEKAVVSFFKPRAMNLFTERKSVYIGTADFLKKSDVDYFVFVKDVDRKEVETYLIENGKLSFDNKQFQVYKLK